VLEEAKGVKKTWAEIKSDARNRSVREDCCGSPMFHGGMTGYYYYYYIFSKKEIYCIFEIHSIISCFIFYKMPFMS
jgi:hypothetical protein